MIKTNNINKTYGNLHVLKDINLAVTPCEIVTLVGASGAGKTTLLQIIGTLDSPDSGQVWINDKLTTEMNDKALCEFRNKEIGFVYQFHHLFSEFTALENVMMPALIGGQNRKDAEEKDKEGGERKIETYDTNKEVVSDANQTIITEKIMYPKMEGAIVIAKGAQNTIVKENIIHAVEAATGLAVHKIQVFEMK